MNTNSRFSLQRACQLIALEEADAAYYRDEYARLGQQYSADKRANDVRAWQCAHAVLTAALAAASPAVGEGSSCHLDSI